jgi:hypothetical protein
MTQEEVEKNLRKKLQKDFEEEYPRPRSLSHDHWRFRLMGLTQTYS